MPTRARRQPPRSPAKAGLGRYLAKRDLAASGEPGSRGVAASRKAATVRRYVIQKHDATRLHYDFRLEMEGVLRSWAVPKGLPMTAGERVLAVEVEDHPLEYGSFEGVIPEGNYGAGTVMLWDRGHYAVADGLPEEAYRAGKIHLALVGEKSIGEWTLVRMQPRPRDKATNWLLIKNSSPAHRAPISGAERDKSVASGRTMDEIASGAKARVRARPPRSATPKKKVAAKPATRTAITRPRTAAEFIPPMKALSVDTVPKGEWRLEIKLDGYRAIAVLNDGEIALWSRNYKPLTADYPEIVEALRRLPARNAVLDGEIVALDEEGKSRFQLLQGRDASGARPRIIFYVFDLLVRDGESLMQRPIEERQAALEKLVRQKSDLVRVSPVFVTDPATLLAEVRKQGLEGIIAKAPGSLYEADRRSGAWLKCKVMGEQEFVIGGYTPPRNSRPFFGAVLVGYYEGDRFIYAGKVGSGYNHALLGSLYAEFQKRRTERCPFANLPMARKSRFGAGMTRSAMREVTWLEPELVCQVRFAEWTHDALLRQPVFLGLRRDKSAKEVVREAAPIAEPNPK